MDNTMEDYYTILHFLRDFFVDREYPLTFDEFDDVDNSDVELTNEYASTHENSYLISDISENEKVTFLIPYRKYDTSDKFEINVCASTEFNPSDITVSFSESKNGTPSKHILTNGKCVQIINGEEQEISVCNANEVYTISFKIKETFTTLDKKVFYMSALQSISLTFKKPFDYVYLSDAVFRTDVYQRTLEDLDQHLIDGKNHILSRVGIGYIPKELEILIPKCAAAYSWIQWWESEGRAMGDGTELSRNYYDRLIDQINASIDSWLNAHPELEPDEINVGMLGYTWVVQ